MIVGPIELSKVPVSSGQAVVGAGLLGAVAHLAGQHQCGLVLGHGLGEVAQGPGRLRQTVERLGLINAKAVGAAQLQSLQMVAAGLFRVALPAKG